MSRPRTGRRNIRRIVVVASTAVTVALAGYGFLAPTATAAPAHHRHHHAATHHQAASHVLTAHMADAHPATGMAVSPLIPDVPADLGHTVCRRLAAGDSHAEIVALFRRRIGFSRPESAALIRQSVPQYCPRS